MSAAHKAAMAKRKSVPRGTVVGSVQGLIESARNYKAAKEAYERNREQFENRLTGVQIGHDRDAVTKAASLIWWRYFSASGTPKNAALYALVDAHNHSSEPDNAAVAKVLRAFGITREQAMQMVEKKEG